VQLEEQKMARNASDETNERNGPNISDALNVKTPITDCTKSSRSSALRCSVGGIAVSSEPQP
jgi:hypothetical protein